MASQDLASAQGSHVPYVDQRIAATRGQGCTIGGESNREGHTPAALGSSSLFPGLPVPQTQAPIIAHTRKPLSIWSKSHPADSSRVAAERLALSTLSHIPDAHGAIRTARGQELTVARRKGQCPD